MPREKRDEEARSHHKIGDRFKAAFEAYRWDHHLAIDTINVLTADELRVLCLSMWGSAPNSTARALALEQPDVELAFSNQEERTQAQLPFTWRDKQVSDAYTVAWGKVHPSA